MSQLYADVSAAYMTEQLLEKSNINPKHIIIPMFLFYLLDLVVIHDSNLGIFKVDIPIFKDIFDIIYKFISIIIYDKLHSQPLAHTIVFGILLILSYNLSDKFKLFEDKKK